MGYCITKNHRVWSEMSDRKLSTVLLGDHLEDFLGLGDVSFSGEESGTLGKELG